MKTKMILAAAAMTFGISAMAKGTGDIGSVGGDINAASLITLIRLTCVEPQTLESCGERVQNALSKLGCHIDTSQTTCGHFLKPDPRNPNGPNIQSETVYCSVDSNNCTKPKMQLFGGDTCYNNFDMLKIPKSEGVHNGYWYGFLGSYSRNICISK